MLAVKAPMGLNSWNTFGEGIPAVMGMSSRMQNSLRSGVWRTPPAGCAPGARTVTAPQGIYETNEKTLLSKGLIAINQDEECRPAFMLGHNGEKTYTMAKIMSGNRIALGFFNLDAANEWENALSISFDDLGIHSESGTALKLTDAVTGEDLGVYRDGYRCSVPLDECKILIGELVRG